jgi:hypothetical protein
MLFYPLRWPPKGYLSSGQCFFFVVKCFLLSCIEINCWAANINWVCWVSENITNLPNDRCSAVCTNKTYYCPWFDHWCAMKPLFVWLHNFLSHECSSTCNNEIWFILIYQPRTQARPANDYKINHCIVTSVI